LGNDKRKILCTIGFSKKSMRRFVELLQGAGAQRVLDVRLNNTSQLAGFAKRDDLEFMLSLVGNICCLWPDQAIYRRKRDTQARGADDYLNCFSAGDT